MELLPAIDIRNGRCVRLLRGDFEKETLYEVDPVELATGYSNLGAKWLHLVDLDGAQSGSPKNLLAIKLLSNIAGLKIQLGGGIRSTSHVLEALNSVERVVIGSLALLKPSLVKTWLKDFGSDHLCLALDVKLDESGVPYVVTHGWTKNSQHTLWALLESYAGTTLKHVLCTDVDRDGALLGPNISLYRECVDRYPDINFQASGGVRDVADLHALTKTGVAYAISGKALLEHRFSKEEISSFLPNG
jgi:phosphoribosylformimino-5-aminoimidazole carboxamide ribotide isomerase